MTSRDSIELRLTASALLVLGFSLGCGKEADAEDGTGGNSSVNSGGSESGGNGAGGSANGGAATGGASSGGATTTGGSGGTFANATCPGDVADAYEGTLRAIPGTVEAEDFDVGGYSDATTGNEGGAYRTDVDVDIKALGSGFALGWMTTGEWVEYTVDVPAGGDYDVTLSAGAVEAGRTLELSSCGTSLHAPIAVPQIAEWGDIATTTSVTIHLTSGVQVIRVAVGNSDYVDFDSISFVPADGGSGTGGAAGTGGASGTGGTPSTVGKFVGNITTYNTVDTDGFVFSEHWDQITPENAGKWGSVQSSAGSQKNWSALDAIYDYAEDKGIIFKQHTFVWGAQQPSGTLTEADVKTWISQFCARYPNTKIIDVVNEPPPHTTPSYANAIGGGTNGNWQWITNAFKWARESCPGAILIINDYNNIEYGDQTQHFIDIVNTAKAAGAPIDAVGAQSHGLSGNISTNTMKTLLTKLHTDTGLPVYITEYDIDVADDQGQLAKFQEHIPFFMDTDWIHGVTIWGWIHGKTWIPDSGLIRNGEPRPAMTWLMQELGRPVPQ